MFAIDSKNCIRYITSSEESAMDESVFASLAQLVEIAQSLKWGKQEVTDIWNGFAGTAGPFANLKPQKCFRNRAYGLRKLWDALQRLVQTVETASEAGTQEEPDTEPCPICLGAGEICVNCGGDGQGCCEEDDPDHCGQCNGTGHIPIREPEPVTATKEETPMKSPAKTKKKRAAKTAKPKAAKAAKGKGKTKRDEVIRLISREKGASLDELVEKMGWERHTLRGLLSTLVSKHGLKIESTKSETKGRVYRLVA